jgi:hypothetical protein
MSKRKSGGSRRRPIRWSPSIFIPILLAAIFFILPEPGIASLLLIQAAASDHAKAQEATEQPGAGASLDVKPVEFSVAGVQYRVPRNYIITMSNWHGGPQEIVTMRVNLIDLGPLTKETQACFAKNPFGISSNVTVQPTSRATGCMPFQFLLEVPGSAVNADQAFANTRGLFHSQEPWIDDSGFEKYEIGPDNARAEFYRKIENGHTRLYWCQIHKDHDDHRDGGCQPVGDRTNTGAALDFFFRLSMVGDIARIDAELRALVESFAVSKP